MGVILLGSKISPSCINQCARLNKDLWHFRLGHLPNDKLKLIEQFSPLVETTDFTNCDDGNRSKHKCTPFPINGTISNLDTKGKSESTNK